MNRILASFCFLFLFASPSFADEPYAPPVKDPAETILAQMKDNWKTPQRLTWRIAYHPVKAMEDVSSWHIEGTRFHVRLYPETPKLDDLDKTIVYELDAVALNQGFGVISFYVYRLRKVK